MVIIFKKSLQCVILQCFFLSVNILANQVKAVKIGE